ncbi:MAG TPA: alginate lyase family protein [Acidobacteriaceae bacterium]|nr:alginate lyase family protein [Acidobacteriaceae bacterium]
MPTPPNPVTRASRRRFCALSAGAALGWSPAARAAAFAAQPQAGTATRPDVAAIDHDRILAAAERYLTLEPEPITLLLCPRSPGTANEYYSEREATTGAKSVAFVAHRDALFSLGLAVPALAAAYALTGDSRYANHAGLHLRAWFVTPKTRMKPSMDLAQAPPAAAKTTVADAAEAHTESAVVSGSYQGILEALPLVEIAQALPFLTPLEETDRAAVRAWFAEYYHWLTDRRDSGPRLAALARDSRNHHATSWLLQASACAYLAAPTGDVGRSEDNALGSLRHLFKSTMLRAQISPDGYFPHEITSQTPYRDSLFNLDMLAAVCQLLSTRLESVWDYQLDEGPSMRAAVAYYFPFIADRGRWPYRADSSHFGELPSRRVSLLFAARAYQRPEYAGLWKTLQPDPPSPEVQRTLPIHQPLLWVRQPPAI